MFQNKFNSCIRKIIYTIFACISIIIVAALLFCDRRLDYPVWAKNTSALPNIFIALICVIALTLIFISWRKCLVKIQWLNNIIDRRFYHLLFGMSVALFAIQAFISWHIYFIAGWDVSIVTGAADWIWTGKRDIGDFYYFSQYTNNITIVYLLALISKFAVWLGFEAYRYYVCVLVDCLLINLAGVLAVLSVNRITRSKKVALLTYILFAGLIGISPWMVVPYTDTFGIIFPVLTFYLYLCAKSAKKVGIAGILSVLMGFSGFFGYYVKPSAVIVLIAIVCYEVVQLFLDSKVRRKVVFRLLCILFAAILAKCMQLHILDYTGCKLNKDLQITYTHYLMMGLNEGNCGAYNADDYAYECQFPDVQTREKGDWKIIKQRLENFGLDGYFEFMIKKLLVNYNDGTFAWEKEGGFELRASNNPVSLWKLRFQRLFRTDGDWYVYYATWAQILWVFSLLVQPFILLKTNKCNSDEKCVLCISIIGSFLFLMLFEARSRYLYNMIPMYIICSCIGIKNLYSVYLNRKHVAVRDSKV